VVTATLNDDTDLCRVCVTRPATADGVCDVCRPPWRTDEPSNLADHPERQPMTATPGTHHPQVYISRGDTSALVDEKIAPLILALWDHGIATQASCQGWTNREELPFTATTDDARLAGISFCSGADADRFALLVRPWRLACELHPGRHPQVNATWRWHATQCGEAGVWVHVRFPAAELPAVLAAAEHPDTRDFGEWIDDHRAHQLEEADRRDRLRQQREEKIRAMAETLPLPGLEYGEEARA
jgi:hypothetical protein